MKRVLIEIQYSGKGFSGWQVQNKKGQKVRTVQEELEKALSAFLKEKIQIFVSGRTDAGVSAKAQTAHFDTTSNLPMEKLAISLVKFLPSDISVISAKTVAADFNARYDAKEKTYHYNCYLSKTRLPLFDETALQVSPNLNFKAMRKAMKYLVGKHDFTSFCKARKFKSEQQIDEKMLKNSVFMEKNRTNVREINKFVFERHKQELVFIVSGNGFLHNMVRIMVGTVLAVGEGKLSHKEVKAILEAKDRTKAKVTLPAKALILWEIMY